MGRKHNGVQWEAGRQAAGGQAAVLRGGGGASERSGEQEEEKLSEHCVLRVARAQPH